LELQLPSHSTTRTPIETTFQVDAIGVYVKAMNADTGESVETVLRMDSDVDFEKSAVNLVDVSGE